MEIIVNFNNFNMNFDEKVCIKSKYLTDMVNNEESFRKLVDDGVIDKIGDVDFFEFAVMKKYRESVKYFLEKYPEFRHKYRNLVHKYAKKDASYSECLKILIDNGFDVNADDRFSKRAVERAIDSDAYDMLKILLDAGAETEFLMCHTLEQTPLLYAVENKCLKCVELLIDAKCDVNSSDKDGKTVAHYIGKLYELEPRFCGSLHSSIVKCRKIADIILPLCSIETMNKLDNFNRSPLFYACTRIDIGRYGPKRLVNAKADIDGKAFSSEFTVLEYAIEYKYRGLGFFENIIRCKPNLFKLLGGYNVFEQCVIKRNETALVSILEFSNKKHLDMINNAIKYAKKELPICSYERNSFIRLFSKYKKKIKKRFEVDFDKLDVKFVEYVNVQSIQITETFGHDQ